MGFVGSTGGPSSPVLRTLPFTVPSDGWGALLHFLSIATPLEASVDFSPGLAFSVCHGLVFVLLLLLHSFPKCLFIILMGLE